MSVARVVVCEKTGRWAAALRSALKGGCDLIETRSLAQCESDLEDQSGLAAIEVTEGNAALAIDWLQRISRWPNVRLVALVSPELAAAEPLLREAGALDVLTSVLDVPRLARMAVRQVAPTPTNQPTIRELVFQRLPWAAHATTK
jgi:hypothetical protein